MKIGVYCGSFDPVHNGHIQIAKHCLSLVDKVLFIPTGNYWSKNLTFSLDDRIEMLKLVIEDNMEVDTIHNKLKYTAQIFNVLNEKYPNIEFCLIIGDDNLERFHEWYLYKYLTSFNIIIVRRKLTKKKILKVITKQNITNYSILDIEPIEISSTYIRENILDYDKIKDMISEKVYNYIKEKYNWKKENIYQKK